MKSISNPMIVTGSCGYIGSHLAHTLKQKGFYVIGVDIKKPEASQLQNCVDEYFQFDISNTNFVESFKNYILQSKLEIKGIFHLAGLKKSDESFMISEDYWKTNFIGTLNVAEIARIFKIKNFVFSSSCSVYGDLEDDYIDENSVTLPISPYGNSKLAAEKLLLSLSTNDFKLIILRFFNVAGSANGFPDQSSTNIFPKLLHSYLSNETFVIHGDTFNTPDGTCVRDYVHVQDIVDAHLLAWQKLNQVNEFSEIINLGSAIGFSVRDVLESFQQILNCNFNVTVGSRRQGDPVKAVSSYEKARILLDFKPKYSLKDMVSSHVDSTIF